jgi:hypothetical protein
MNVDLVMEDSIETISAPMDGLKTSNSLNQSR